LITNPRNRELSANAQLSADGTEKQVLEEAFHWLNGQLGTVFEVYQWASTIRSPFWKDKV
jgi:hypothetical protein